MNPHDRTLTVNARERATREISRAFKRLQYGTEKREVLLAALYLAGETNLARELQKGST